MADLGLSGNVFCGVGAATEKTQVPAFIFTLGIDRVKTLGIASNFELDDWSCLSCLAGMSIESDEGRFDKRAW